MNPERLGTVPFSHATQIAAGPHPQPVVHEDATPPLVVPGKPTDIDKYTSEAMRKGVIDEAGTLLIPSKEPIALDDEGRLHVLNFWKTTRAGLIFPWNLHSFLESLVHCFHSPPYEGSTIIQTQGTLCTAGQEFWKKTFHEKIKPFGLDECIASDMWNFCSPPHRFEFWVTLPPKHENEFLYLQQLALYFWALQALPEKPKDEDAALTEFMLLTGRVPDENPTERIKELRRITGAMQPSILFWNGISPRSSKRFATVEFFCSPITSVKVVFAFTFKEIDNYSPDQFRLEIFPDEKKDPTARLITSEGDWQGLHDCLINKMLLPDPIQDLSTVEFALVKYCVLRTCGGAVLDGHRLENRLAGAFMQRKNFPPFAGSFGFGIPLLTPGNDAVVAYFSNVARFFKKFKELQAPDLIGSFRNLVPSTPMGRLLSSDDFLSGRLDSILQIVGGLIAGLNQSLPHAPDCRQVAGSNELQISWKTDSVHHFLIPFNFEEALKEAAFVLKQKDSDFLPILSKVLEILMPTLTDDGFNETSQNSMDPRLAAIYYALRNHGAFLSSALRLSFLLRGNGWKVIDESDLLELPAYLGNLLLSAGPESEAELPSTLNQLARGYQNSPFEAQFGEVRSHVLAVENPTPRSCQLAALKPLLTSGEQRFAALAWTQYVKFAEHLKAPRRLAFLVEMAPLMPAESLSLALNRVNDFCKPGTDLHLPREGQVRLFCTYLERLIRFSPQYPCLQHASLMFKEAFIHSVMSCIEIDPMLRLHILSYPQLADELFSSQEARSALLGCLEQKLSSENSDTFMHEVYLSLSHFVKAQDKRIFRVVEGWLTLILKVPEAHAAWAKFAEVLMVLQKDDHFLEESVILLERISAGISPQGLSLQSPPFQCFRNPFPRIGRLAQKQKERLVVAYLPFMERDAGLTEVFPQQWLVGQQRHLKRDDAWVEFTRLFLFLNRENQDNADVAAMIQDALWIAPRLLASSDHAALANDFTGRLVDVRTDSLATTEWKPHLIALIVRNPAKARLFAPLIELCVGEENDFFTACKRLQERRSFAEVKTSLIEYQTGKIPKLNGRKVKASQQASKPEDPSIEIRRNILVELKRKPVPLKNLTQVLSLLKKLPSEEFSLWLSFFRAFPVDPPKEFHPLLEESASSWFKQHPPETVKPEEGTYWREVLPILYRNRSLSESSFAHFMINHAPLLLERLDLETCKVIAQFCMEGAVIYGTNNPGVKNTPVLEAVNTISARLTQKVAFPKALIDQDDQSLLHLLFAQQVDQSFHEVGAAWYMECIKCYLGRPPENSAERPRSTSASSQDVSAEGNGKLFTNYCTKPYVPRTTDSQEVFLEWFEKSWGLHRKQLNWNDACATLTTLLEFNFDEMNTSIRSHHLRQIYHCWNDLHEEGWSGLATRKGPDGKREQFVIQRSSILHVHVTKVLMDKLMQNSKDPLEMLLLLNEMRNRLSSIHRNDALMQPTLLNIRRDYCTHIFSLDLSQAPDAALPLKMALDDLHACRKLFQIEMAQELDVIQACKKCAGAFIDALPCLLNQNEPAIEAMVKANIENLRGVSWVRNAPALERYSWEALLVKLCSCVRTVSPERGNAVVRFTREVFMNCTHRGDAASLSENSPMEDFIKSNTISLARRFMTMHETDCLSKNEWDELIHGLSGNPVRDAIDSLYQNAQEIAPIDSFWNCLAVARLVRHAKTDEAELLHYLQGSIASGTSPGYLEIASAQEVDLRLRYLSHWILAISNFIDRCDEHNVEINGDLIIRRIHLTNELTEVLFPQITDAASFKKYSLILGTLLNNLDVAVLIRFNFGIGQGLPVDLISQLSSLRNAIDRKIALLEEKITPRSCVTLSHLIRQTKTDQKDHLDYLQHLCVVGTSPRLRALVSNLEVDNRLHYLSHWILAISNMMAKWHQNDMDVVAEELIDRKIELTREIIGVILSCIKDEATFEAYATYFIELSKDLDVAQLIIDNLIIDPTLPSDVIDSFSTLKTLLERHVEAKRKE